MTAVPYHRDLAVMNRFLIAVSVADLVATELLVPWAPVRWALLVLGVLGLGWVLAYAASLNRLPHLVGTHELRVRFSWSTDIRIPLALVARARRDWCGNHSRTVEFDGDTVSVSVSNMTTVLVELTQPIEVQGNEITRVRFHADDPDAAVGLLRTSRIERRPAFDHPRGNLAA